MRSPRIKRRHEFRDPIHNFISMDRQERALVDTEPFQRLRHIHQLALTYNVYPGATHRRFEHSLGVMHLAGRVFDVVTDPANRHPETEYLFPDNLEQWKITLRLAALCHDLGHLPFSHAAEKKLLPRGMDHETITLSIIESDFFKDIWRKGSNIDIDDVKKLAVGSKKLKGVSFSDWEAILSEIITGDSFGVDRMDYLLRDSFHLGVSYGRFDHLKLIESLRILPQSSLEEGSREPALGVELNGLHSAEALLLARYFMYEQVYFHHIRRIYDHHLIQFMESHYGINGYPSDVTGHVRESDNEVLTAMRRAAADPNTEIGQLACRVLTRQHFRRVYERSPSDEERVTRAIAAGKITPAKNQDDLSAAKLLFTALSNEFDPGLLHYDSYAQSSDPSIFPVLMPDYRVEESTSVSLVLRNLPLTRIKYIFAARAVESGVRDWITANSDNLFGGA